MRESVLLEEARALARVRHPGVVAVYGIAQHDGRVGMWMEFLEGSTLAAEIERRGSLTAAEVVRIGLALCRALEALEAAGLVHRDLKPSNVVLEADGRVVLTDFGLGQRWELANGSHASGTPVFMSPEVLSGEPATPRSDVYALGVTLRWALTGRPPFKAANLEELRVEARTGPATSLARERPDAPAAVVEVIERAMAPNGDERYASAAPMAAALESACTSMTSHPRRRLRQTMLWALRAALVVASAVALAGLLERTRAPSSVRLSVIAPPRTTFSSDPAGAVVSPDGKLLAFVAVDSTGTTWLWVRPLSSLAARPLEGTIAADLPFWSPDSRSLGFFAQGKLKKVSVAGGVPEVICPAPDARGGSWGKNGVIVFAPVPTGPLCRVSAEGGPVSVLLRPDSTRHETAFRWPAFLPDGKHFLCVALPAREGGFDVDASSVDSPGRRRLLRCDSAPVVAGRDQLIFARDGMLMAQQFDFGRLRPTRSPVSLGPSTACDQSVAEPVASASRNGVLVHQNAVLPNTQLVWLDRSGRPQGSLAAPEARYENGSLSPDGRRLAVVRRTSPAAVDLWMIDVATGSSRRLTSRSQSRIGGIPAWSPDGVRIAFSSTRNGPTNIYVKNADEAPEDLLYQSPAQFKETGTWTPDARFLFFGQTDPATGWDVWLLPMQGARFPIPYMQTRFYEAACVPSPDGEWVAYISDEAGTGQVYVKPFARPGPRRLVSETEAIYENWSRDGRELMLFSSDRTLWSVPVTTRPTFRAESPKLLFKWPEDALWAVPTPDHDRLLIAVPERNVAPSTLTVVMNWAAQLRPGRTESR